jgi:hypothetical protein
MSIDQAALIRSIYDTIFMAYTQPPLPGLPAVSQPDNLFLTLEWPGQQLDPSQFSNPWSPQNLSGSPLATEYFANLVNPIPALSAIYADSGITVEEIYKTILLLATVPPLPSGELNPLKSVFNNARQTFDFSKLTSSLDPLLNFHAAYATPGDWYDESASKSWTKVTIRSSQSKTTTNSPFMQAGGVEQATAGLWKIPAKTVASIDPEQVKRLKRTLPAEPTLRSRIQTQAKAPTLETIENLPTYSTQQLDYFAAKETYDNAVASLNATRFQYDLADPSQKQQWEAIAPSLETAVRVAWTKLQPLATVNVEPVQSATILRRSTVLNPDLTTQLNPTLRQLEFDAAPNLMNVINASQLEIGGRPLGRISTIGQASASRDLLKRYLKIRDSSLDQATSDLQISFRFCRVSIRRPWFLMSLLTLNGWSLASQAAGSLSTGKLDVNPGSFPLLPTAFIAIRDLEIRGSWSSTDRKIAEMAAAGSGTVGFGPFALSGRYGSDQAGATYTAKFDGQVLSAPGLQSLCRINHVVPFSPQLGS